MKIKSIFCTTTITEGVNTTAKKLIIFDNKKGQNRGGGTNFLSKFEVKNMKGRAGRFLHHFVGQVYTITELAKKQEISFSELVRRYLDDAIEGVLIKELEESDKT